MWDAFVWIGKVAYHVVKWLVLHPVATVVIGVGVYTAGVVLANQPWAGAAELGNWVMGFGKGLVTFGLAAYLGRGLIPRMKEVVAPILTWFDKLMWALGQGPPLYF